MLFTKLIIENFGAFRGIHTFNLTPQLDKNNTQPIILFGGLNGSGKTTLFEGIKVCLYGQIVINNSSKKDYEEYIKGKILPKHKSEGQNCRGAVQLELIYSSYGQTQLYSIRRFWLIKHNKVEEKIQILRDGQILGSIEKENSQAFLMNLIPRGLTELFFFDGEKIQSLANDHNNKQFKEAFDSMLGLDAIQKLQTDLKILNRRLDQNYGDDRFKKALRSLESSKSEFLEKLDILFQQKAKKQSQIDSVNSRIEFKEMELANQGGGYAIQREFTKKKIVETEEEISGLKNEIRVLCSSLFPFSIIPELCIKLRKRLFSEQNKQMRDSAKQLFQEKTPEFLDQARIQILSKHNLPKKEEDTIMEQMSKLFNSIFATNSAATIKLIHDFSDTELTNITSWIDQSLDIVPSQMLEKTKKLEKATKKQRELENLLHKVPAEEVISPIIEEINQLHQNYGAFKIEFKRIENELSSTQHGLVEIQREIHNNYQEIEKAEKFQRRIHLLKKVRETLSIFSDTLRKRKIDTLSNNFTIWLNRLLYKENLISKVIVSPNDYSIKLQQSNENFISKIELSDGEKQIYAIAMLMALARTSGYSLPFIIDTPLARLDNSHRKNIISDFFPYASHQVIMFSTDTEIDKQYFKKLTPKIARVYHLIYQPDSISTIVKKDYFWKKEEVIAN